MAAVKIKGGYYIKARCIQDSDIFYAPPVVRELWDWLLMNANHSRSKYSGYTIERGQLFRSYKEILDGLSWRVGWRKESYTENQLKKSMKNLRESQRITTRKEPRGILITITNYDYYQDPKNYEKDKEGTTEGTNESTIEEPRKEPTVALSINKNDKNYNPENGSNTRVKKFVVPTLEEVRAYCLERGNSVDAETWYNNYTAKGWMIGNNKMKDWKASVRLWERGNGTDFRGSRYADRPRPGSPGYIYTEPPKPPVMPDLS